jgi:uncharacterized lipoprotein
MRTLLATLALVLSTACALTTDHVALQYQPMQGVQALPEAPRITVAVSVADLRTEKTKVSCKKNGFGMEMAPIVPTEEPVVTLRKALEGELAARGFTLAQEARVLVKSDLLRFWNDFKTGLFTADAVADLNMTIVVQSRTGDRVVFTKQINVQGTEKNNMLQVGNNARLALDKALANGLAELFGDKAFIDALLKEAPAQEAPAAETTAGRHS